MTLFEARFPRPLLVADSLVSTAAPGQEIPWGTWEGGVHPATRLGAILEGKPGGEDKE